MEHHTRQGAPEEIGDFLVRIGVMQPWQLEDVLLAQRLGDKRLFGEIAIELGYFEDKALQLYIESQSRDPTCTTAVPTTRPDSHFEKT
jgi:hypothetical protein